MYKQNLLTVIEKAIVDIASDYIIERMLLLSKIRRKLVVLFTGTELGLDKSLKALTAINSTNDKVDIIFSHSAERIFSSRLSEIASYFTNLNQTYKASEVAEDHLDSILHGARALLMPTLTFNTAAKIANQLSDSVPSMLVQLALLKGIPVEAALDGCCPSSPNNTFADVLLNHTYSRQLSKNLEILKSYGVTLVAASKLGENVIPNCSEINAYFNDKVESVHELKISKRHKVFSRQDVMMLPLHVCCLNINSETIITPYAVDELNQRGILLNRE